ncbi:hypothetical protein Q4491_12670 [Photobacterium sp. 2_MG-2023]|uniref:hypothetical protein n=1 Tax=Photobacterium sp. 2_MG-2023 TaxID=3062663 RepID=UPI0026E2D382|nr:hypothetical protein [Photobacterium sp. 2_MG-2023]MDO6582193.1 hypothetical protein [Photobacterium sp. 2_MG-2023]
MIYDIIVLGNGILGSMATYLLSEKYGNILNISTPYAFRNEIYSSHFDESRIVHFDDQDPYWNDMAKESDKFNKEISVNLDSPFYRDVDFYQSTHAWQKLHAQAESTESIDGAPRNGAILNPMLYINTLKSMAVENGVKFIENIANIEYSKMFSHYYVQSKMRTFVCKRIIDTRGAYICLDDLSIGKVAGKSLYFFEHDAGVKDFCFLVPISHEKFTECYGVYQYDKVRCVGQLKIGFSEIQPECLDSKSSIIDWFRNSSSREYQHADAIYFIKEKFSNIQNIAIKPCMFTLTQSGYPKIVRDKNLIRIAGCNGKAAKCAYSMIRSILTDEGFF